MAKIVVAWLGGSLLIAALAGCDSGPAKSPTTERCIWCNGTGHTKQGACLSCAGRGYRVVGPDELDKRSRAEENQRRIARGEAPVSSTTGKGSNGTGPWNWLERNFGKTVAVIVLIAVVFVRGNWAEIKKGFKGSTGPPGDPPPAPTKPG